MATAESELQTIVIGEGGDAADDGVDLTEHVFGNGNGDDDTQEGSASESMLDGYREAGGMGAQDDDGQRPAATPAPTAAPRAQAPAPTQAPVKIGRWTEDEVAKQFDTLEAVQKRTEQLFGRFGDLHARLQAKPREVKPEDLAGIAQEFGPEYAQALAADLNKIGFGQSAGVSQEQIDALVAAKTNELERRFELGMTRMHHADMDDYFAKPDPANPGQWIPGAKNADYLRWFATLPVERQQVLATSWDSATMSAALTEAKAFLAKAPEKPASTAQTRQNRLARGLQPQGAGSSRSQAPAEDSFSSGYNEAKAGR